jgi:RNA polymerase sigma factor (sigma-70 family)
MEKSENSERAAWLAGRFEENRSHLRAVAYRMLGSASEADDAVQDAWLRLSRSDASTIENLGGWLTAVVARICLDILRSRRSRKEESLETQVSEPTRSGVWGTDPEQVAVLADSVSIALLIVLDRLDPPERLAFVLHDMFAVSFDEIASILGRSPDATRQLASRARRRVQAAPAVPRARLTEQRDLVNAFLSALRAGDFEGLVAVLDPQVVVRIDDAALSPGAAREIHGAATWAKGAIAFSRQFHGDVHAMLIDGQVGMVWAPHGRVLRVLRFSIVDRKIAAVEVIGDRQRIEELDLGMLGS